MSKPETKIMTASELGQFFMKLAGDEVGDPAMVQALAALAQTSALFYIVAALDDIKTILANHKEHP
jgi:hypothetical protein